MIRVAAPAKINLYLHVLGRRADGYHELDSLVAFADIADLVAAQPAAGLSLTIDEVNAEPALIVRSEGRLQSIFVLSIEEDAIAGIRVVRNPDKLAHIDRELGTVH